MKQEKTAAADPHYLALGQIERSMQNEISTLSLSSTRLVEYMKIMKASNLQINGALKAMHMLAQTDDKLREPQSAKALRIWMHALYKASKSPLRALMFRSIAFDQPIYPEFLAEVSRPSALDKRESRESWLVVIGWALVCAGFVAALVLLLHWNFYLVALLFLLVYIAGLAYYFFWLQRKLEISWLKQLTRQMSPPAEEFVRSIDVPSLSWFADPGYIELIFQTLLSRKMPVPQSRITQTQAIQTDEGKKEKKQSLKPKKSSQQATIKTGQQTVQSAKSQTAKAGKRQKLSRRKKNAAREAIPVQKPAVQKSFLEDPSLVADFNENSQPKTKPQTGTAKQASNLVSAPGTRRAAPARTGTSSAHKAAPGHPSGSAPKAAPARNAASRPHSYFDYETHTGRMAAPRPVSSSRPAKAIVSMKSPSGSSSSKTKKSYRIDLEEGYNNPDGLDGQILGSHG